MTDLSPGASAPGDPPATIGTLVLRTEAPATEPAIPLGAILGGAIRRWRWAIVAAFLGALIGLMFAVRSDYVATSIIMPDDPGADISRLAGLAAQFGFNIPSASGSGPGVEFYARLVESRELLTALAVMRFPDDTEGSSVDSTETLLAILGFDEDDPHDNRLDAVEHLRDKIVTTTDRDAGLLAIEIAAPSRDLAERVNRALLGLIERFNLERRQVRASYEREFIEQRLEVARNELRDAEEALEAFLTANRTYESSPDLVLIAGRLQRDIELKQRIFLSLSESLEQSRIEEVRDTPVFTIVDAPEGSAEREFEFLPTVLLGFGLGILVWGSLSVTIEVLRAVRGRSEAQPIS